MRGRLWRGWLWTPRVWWSKLRRGAEVSFEGERRQVLVPRAKRGQTRARWWHEPWWWSGLRYFAVIVAALLVIFQFFVPLYRVVVPDGTTGLWPDGIVPDPCSGARKPHCDQIAAFLDRLIAAALTFTVFYLLTFWRVRKFYLRKAIENPQGLVPTATNIIDQVVGRDELCEVLVERIRDPHVRCPIVLVGGVGTGKTAVLVRLTCELARRNIVAIPIRMRDADDKEKLNFQTLAKNRFLNVVDRKLFTDGHAELLWRRLRMANQVAVLADGLEESLTNVDEGDRDSVLREAVQQAITDGLPLIIASRPHDPLHAMNAIVIGLEPLGEGAALEYGLVGEHSSSPLYRSRISGLVNAADVPESPVFMKIIRDLQQHDRLPLEIVERAESSGPVSSQGDRFATRFRLLMAWEKALVSGAIRADYANSLDERCAALDTLSAFACVGVLNESPQVSFDQLTDNGRWEVEGTKHSSIYSTLREKLKRCNLRPDREHLTRAVSLGSELLIVESQSGGVRFQHGIIHAYLAARFMHGQPLPAKLGQCLEKDPSRELLIAAVILSRWKPHRYADPARDGRRGKKSAVGKCDQTSEIIKLMLDKATNSAMNSCRRLELYATVIEVGMRADPLLHDRIVQRIRSQWDDFRENEASPDRPLDEAKLLLVRRIGDAARWITAHWRQRSVQLGRPTPSNPSSYRGFFELAKREHSHRVRWAAAREIGLGGAEAFLSLADSLGPSKKGVALGEKQADDKIWHYGEQLRGWALPLIYLSAWHDHYESRDERAEVSGAVRATMQKWIEAMARYHPLQPEEHFPIVSEMALAQGFRLAANMRRLPSDLPTDNRSVLIEQAEQALAHSRYWYSQLVLIQALTLLSLPDDPQQRLPSNGHGANPDGMVRQWLRLAGSKVPGRDQREEHPFLSEVARLCVDALLTRRPERFCWIDESETASRVGSCSAEPAVHSEQRQLIPDSMGWSVLTKRAQRLLADIMLLFNLAHRGDGLLERELRLARADRQDLPPCLTRDRRALQPSRGLNTDKPGQPGDGCLDGCPFRLCPLPARGERLPDPMDQNFCARQADLAALGYVLQARAPWQSVPRPILQEFWREMSERELPSRNK